MRTDTPTKGNRPAQSVFVSIFKWDCSYKKNPLKRQPAARKSPSWPGKIIFSPAVQNYYSSVQNSQIHANCSLSYQFAAFLI